MLHSCALILLLIGIVVVPTCAQTDTRHDDEQEIRAVNDQEVHAFLNRDAQAMDSLWSDDLVVTNPLNKLVTKAEVLEMVKSGFLVITSYERKIEYLHIYGDMAVVAGSETVVWGGKMPVAGRPEVLRFTGIWSKQRGRWREIARHANIVPSSDASTMHSSLMSSVGVRPEVMRDNMGPLHVWRKFTPGQQPARTM
jgi:ketosteroid isomerase-like protein